MAVIRASAVALRDTVRSSGASPGEPCRVSSTADLDALEDDIPAASVVAFLEPRSQRLLVEELPALFASGTGPGELTLTCRDGRQLTIDRDAGVIRVVYGGRVLGLFDVCSSELDSGTIGPWEPLAALAALVGSSIARCRAQEEIRKFKTIADEANYGVFIADLDETITYVNACLARMRGCDAEALRLQRFSELLVEEDQLRWKALSRELIDTGSLAPAELSLRHGEDSSLPALFAGILIRSPDGVPLHVACTIIDLSERKRLEEEQRRLEAEIQTSQRIESLAVLAGGIAHDFNNLLTGVLGSASLAAIHLTEDSPALEYVERIQTAARRASDLSTQLLAYSGRSSIALDAIDLSALVEEMAQLLDVSVPKTTVLTRKLTPGLPAIEGDATQIRQVVMNLITNASAAIGAGPGEILVRTGLLSETPLSLQQPILGQPDPECDHVFLQVADNGCGMDEDTCSRIFDPFFTTKSTGHGLGLAAVLGIVRGHGGTIHLDTKPGRGTVFTVVLPVTERTTVEPAAFTLREASLEPECSGTVLVADDEEILRQICTAALEMVGYRVLVAVDGDSAVRTFRDHSAEISLVLIDMSMPKLDGAAAVAQIREIQADVPIIVISGYSAEDLTRRLAGEPRLGCPPQPFAPLELISPVRAALAQ